ncbi:LOW QUALITY PROTEIN: microtubule-associated protein futsch-like [Centruroides vittatus]|uniref:LOW QUALITY PROTEIN: microtubule-associated protein futsch-like n=1 Tax=Centruroides vittatus TaxID=120091 RepID=UPI00350EDEEE
MPGSVRRSDSQRSDSSTDSRKKVSFNRAVKVKKYSRPGKHSQSVTESPEKKFWFKVYKNRHHQEPDLVKETREFNANCNNVSAHDPQSDSLHPSQMPAETPHVRKDHVRHIVNLFNQEAVLKPTSEDAEHHSRPMDPPTDYNSHNSEHKHTSPKQKKNPLVNGVKVMFGMNSLKKKTKDEVHKKNAINLKKTRNSGNKIKSNDQKGPHKTNIIIPDIKRISEVDSSYHRYNDKMNGNGYPNSSHSYHPDPTTATWDSGKILVSDSSQVDNSLESSREGKFYKSAGERHRIWKQDKVTRYEEPIFITRKKISSENDLSDNKRTIHTQRLDYSDEELNKSKQSSKNKIIHTQRLDYSDEELNISKHSSKNKTHPYSKAGLFDEELNKSKHSSKNKTIKEDKAIQCDEFWTDSDSWDSETQSDSEFCRIIRSKNGFVSAFSDVPSLESYEKNDAIYSQVDKSKKKKNMRPPLATPSDIMSEDARAKEDSYKRHTKENKIKTTKRSFGFKLRNGFQEDVYDIPIEKDWYDVDDDLQEIERQKKSEESSDADTAPNSVIREVDYKKREISYENVPRKDGSRTDQITKDRNLWFHKADDDYRRDMVFNEGTMDSSYSSLGRITKSNRKSFESGQAQTLDRHHYRNNHGPSNVKILVNGKPVKDDNKQCLRGGLAASYQARQKAALRRSNSTAGGVFVRPVQQTGLSPNRGGSSAASGISSSDSESSRRHKPLVLYIPGVEHPDHSINEDDRSSGANVARTQSMLSSSKPAKYRSKYRNTRHSGSEKSDLSRSNSMPKDVKFPWFKWKIRAKPSREP